MLELDTKIKPLTLDQYIRIEALKQAVASIKPSRPLPVIDLPDQLIERALFFENYIRNGKS